MAFSVCIAMWWVMVTKFCGLFGLCHSAVTEGGKLASCTQAEGQDYIPFPRRHFVIMKSRRRIFWGEK